MRSSRLLAREFVDALGVAHRYVEPAIREGVADGTVSSELQGTGHAVCRVLAGLRDQFADARSSYEFLRRMGLGFSVALCERMPLSGASSHPDLEVRV